MEEGLADQLPKEKPLRANDLRKRFGRAGCVGKRWGGFAQHRPNHKIRQYAGRHRTTHQHEAHDTQRSQSAKAGKNAVATKQKATRGWLFHEGVTVFRPLF
jgi:hypothetical protein